MANQQPRIRIQVSDDKKDATLEFLPASGLSGSLTLTLDQLTALITGLGMARRQMVEGQPNPPINNQQFQTISNARWYIQPEPLTEGSLLAFSHPSFGPVGFVVPRDQIAEMVRVLTVHLRILPSSGSKPN